MDGATRFVAAQNLEAAPLENGAVIYDPQTKKFVMLNRSATLIWNELATPKTRDDLVRQVCAVFPDVDAVAADKDVNAALEQLTALELVSGAS